MRHGIFCDVLERSSPHSPAVTDFDVYIENGDTELNVGTLTETSFSPLWEIPSKLSTGSCFLLLPAECSECTTIPATER